MQLYLVRIRFARQADASRRLGDFRAPIGWRNETVQLSRKIGQD